MSIPVLTIDGPSGAGKGTVSRLAAKKLGWHYLDSGSIYRSLALAVAKQGVDLADEAAIVSVAEKMHLEFECEIDLTVRLNGIDVTAEIPLESTGAIASTVAAIPDVRRVLLQKQRDFKQLPGLVADGRDMGTVVFKEAPFKVFLTASVGERAMRRYKQLIEKGIDANLIQITNEIEERDRRDRERATAPLAMASDALYLDSSDMTIDSVVEEVLNLVRTGLNERSQS
ncbi:(d)CMP kinase [Methylomicrobium sp. Wu6]|uniref:(d)CMP kinase n=1 Tax=Methylomicrobium sp. Wu6 TaxID=3107928 RepID=UPI002DD67B5C|nr:(d)CMP kinase [Methylomicrobium sp. Wu6]MEC4747878.1 (d)CMP kinase [Methylomicrobium sp. Wu6]